MRHKKVFGKTQSLLGSGDGGFERLYRRNYII